MDRLKERQTSLRTSLGPSIQILLQQPLALPSHPHDGGPGRFGGRELVVQLTIIASAHVTTKDSGDDVKQQEVNIVFIQHYIVTIQ